MMIVGFAISVFVWITFGFVYSRRRQRKQRYQDNHDDEDLIEPSFTEINYTIELQLEPDRDDL